MARMPRVILLWRFWPGADVGNAPAPGTRRKAQGARRTGPAGQALVWAWRIQVR